MSPFTILILIFAILLALGWLLWPEQGLLARLRRNKEFAARVLREDALKHLKQCEAEDIIPTIPSVAGALRIGVDDATQLLRYMEDLKLVEHLHGAYQLTKEGRDYALHIIRSHRLWESYLANHTGYGEREWHDRAERMEHKMSSDQTEQLSRRLGHPTHDPHGDPIPTATGEWKPLTGNPLDHVEGPGPWKIVHIEDEPPIIYEQILAEELFPGHVLEQVEKQERSIHFWSGGIEHIIAPVVAANITVEEIPRSQVVDLSNACRLSELSLGESSHVLQLSPTLRGRERRRLLDLGILPGTKIKSLLLGPGGSPTGYQIRGTLVALRKEQTDQIYIEKCEDIQHIQETTPTNDSVESTQQR